MAFEKLFDNPLYGNHAPLVLRWTDDQLEPLVDRLAPFSPDNLSDQMQLAIASCARSIVAEKKLTDRAVHYARRRDAYRVPQRYRCGDPRYSWHYITRSIDTLEQIGLIKYGFAFTAGPSIGLGLGAANSPGSRQRSIATHFSAS